ncbi:PAS domain S-box protein [Methylococcus sp. EFPC2]|uniref:PAS domain S-box protein n=1 Tax=Methylococcus sp. EFPC2 TaxID=2812648 RepID=UPI0019672BBC|nr:PAS domain S-box protein [Methylococcus sp. EFPC2]QSA98479.1 PAS domain S-box protein [Methylococcus sp. EFPC2]
MTTKHTDTDAHARVLVVEDEALVAEEIRDRLTRLGYEVVGVADTGRQAIAAAEQTRPGLVLMDIRLKGRMDGIEAGEHIYRRWEIPVVFLTAHSDQATFERAKLTAPFGYILKPFRERDLLMAIEMALHRHSLEQNLKESHFTFHTILNSVAEGVIATDVAGRVRFMNPKAEVMTGWCIEDAQGQALERVLMLADEASRAPVNYLSGTALHRQPAFSSDQPVILLDRSRSSEIPVEISAAPIISASGKLAGAAVSFLNISARRRAEQTFRHLLESAPDAMVIADESNRIVLVNSQVETLFGYPRHELQGQPIEVLIPERFRAKHPEHSRRYFANPSVRAMGTSLEVYGVTKDGTEFPVEVRLSQLATPDGLLVSSIIRDISERKQAEDQLRENESLFRGLVETSPIPKLVLTADASNRVLLMNKSFTEKFGYTVNEVWDIGSWWERAYPDPLERRRIKQAWSREARTADCLGQSATAPLSARVTCLDGSHRDVEVSMGRFGSRALVIFNDLTERVRAEESLRISEARLRAIVENMPILMTAYCENGLIVGWNSECERVTGYSAEEIIGNPHALEMLYPDSSLRERMKAEWEVRDVPHHDWSGSLTGKDGTTRTIEWSNVSAQFPIPGWAYWGVGVDVTERLKLEGQLQQTQKMESIGQLTGGIAHDFNNILAAILGYTELAQMNSGNGLSPKLVTYLAEIHLAAERAKALVAQLLAFSRSEAVTADVILVAPVVKEITKLFRATFPSSLSVTLELPDHLPNIRINPVQLHQVLMNLGINARDATQGKGRMDIRVNAVFFDTHRVCSSCHYDFQGEFVMISIKDQGHGIPAKHISRLFEPFFTTKEVGRGTGLGLSVLHGIVHAAGGHVEVISGGGRGAEFRVYFPAVAPAIEAMTFFGPHAAPGLAPRVRGRVMVVDDEPSIVSFTRDLLENIGCKVSGFTDPREALSVFRAEPAAYDLVITDQTMPGLTGAKLARELLRLSPVLPVILCTGYSNEIDESTARQHGISKFLLKPVPMVKLFEAVNELLPSSGSVQPRE